MTRRFIAVLGALAIAAVLMPAIPAQAKSPTCGWTDNVTPLMSKADKQVRAVDIAAKAEKYYGPGVTVTAYKRMEVDLKARRGATTRPTNPATLTDNRVTYNLQLDVPGADSTTASVQMRYDGLCKLTAVFRPEAWVGSSGTDKPLRVGAKKALRLAEQYRVKNGMDLDEPLVMMNLMQSTTAPPDYGKLRWYVNYDNGAGGLSILAVYMNGIVKRT
jgi:hypothetical protein